MELRIETGTVVYPYCTYGNAPFRVKIGYTYTVNYQPGEPQPDFTMIEKTLLTELNGAQVIAEDIPLLTCGVLKRFGVEPHNVTIVADSSTHQNVTITWGQ